MSHWQTAIAHCHQRGEGFVVITLLETKGSTPRDQGSKMVVTDLHTFDTIGGGALEKLVTDEARRLLAFSVPAQQLNHFPLAAKANQCCGGSVAALFEVFPPPRLTVAIFGAGHVGRAVVKVLGECEARVDWIDARVEQFPETSPGNVQQLSLEQPESYVSELSDQTLVLVLTHDHALDYRLLKSLLDETEIGYIGLIGSQTKADRFRGRLRHDGIPSSEDRRWRCPVGLDSVKGKLPMEVAVSIVSEVLSLPQSGDPAAQGVPWKSVQRVLGKS